MTPANDYFERKNQKKKTLQLQYNRKYQKQNNKNTHIRILGKNGYTIDIFNIKHLNFLF